MKNKNAINILKLRYEKQKCYKHFKIKRSKISI